MAVVNRYHRRILRLLRHGETFGQLNGGRDEFADAFGVVSNSVAMRPLVPTLSMTITAHATLSPAVFLTVSSLCLTLFRTMRLSVSALPPYVFLRLRQNSNYPAAWQMTPNPSAAFSENVSLVHMKSYVVLVLTAEVSVTLFSSYS